MHNLPRHIAIVMDGNGRWATQRKLPRVAGHRAGSKTVREIVEYSVEIGIEALTLFAFSLENRARPESEVNFLMSLFLDSLEKNTGQLSDNNVQLRIIGDQSRFDKELLAQIERSESLTQHNSGLKLAIAINYSGRWDILRATQQLAKQVAENQLLPEDITAERFQRHLCLTDLPAPDLLIRTSGEQRLSNFMLWQFAYTEIYFTPVYWPDFHKASFNEALEFYRTRERRFGLTPEQTQINYLKRNHHA